MLARMLGTSRRSALIEELGTGALGYIPMPRNELNCSFLWHLRDARQLCRVYVSERSAAAAFV